jgi:hypothetical protein
MAINTLVEGNKYSTTMLQKVVTDLLAKDSRVTELMPFEDIKGNSLTYDVITTRSGASSYAVGDPWVESTPELTPHTAVLKIIGGDADVDNFLMTTRNQIDMKTLVVNDKIRAVNEKFMNLFFYGNATTSPKEFDGLQVLMSSTTYNTVHAGSSTGSVLSIAKLRAAIDLMMGYRNQKKFIIMTKTMRTGISVYLDSIGDKFPRTVNEYGKPIEMFDGMEIIVDDNLLNTETAASGAYTASTGGANTTIFIVTFAPQACCGLSTPERIQTKSLGELETKDATRTRIKWYCGLKLEDIRSCVKVDGVVAAGTVTA